MNCKCEIPDARVTHAVTRGRYIPQITCKNCGREIILKPDDLKRLADNEYHIKGYRY